MQINVLNLMYTDFQGSQLDTTVRGWGGRRGERKMEEWEMGGKEGEKEGGMGDGREGGGEGGRNE